MCKKTKCNTEILSYILMLLPAMIMLLIFNTAPLFGLALAFQKYVPAKGILGSKWVGLSNFQYMLMLPDSMKVLRNTLIISVLKIICNVIFPVCFALLLNEVKNILFQKTVQTIVYMPHFLSWVILGGIFSSMLSMDGIFNSMLSFFGAEKIMFLGSNSWFRPIIVITDVWKNFGYGAIIYLAALTAIDPSLYEAASIDGANRFSQLINVTLPCIIPTIILMTTLSLSNVLNAGFDQIFNMYNSLVYETGDIIDTFVFRIGMIDMQYSLSTTVGLLKSVVSFILITSSYTLAYKFSGYKLF